MFLEPLEPRRLLASVTGLILVDADAGKDIRPLQNGATIDLAKLPAHLAVRATATSDTQSVRFYFNSASQVENEAPYAMAGDELVEGAERFHPWAAPAGQHVLSAVAYTADDARGEAGPALTVEFSVVGEVRRGGELGPAQPGQAPVWGPGLPGEWSRIFNQTFDSPLNPKIWGSRFWWHGNVGGGGQMEVYDPIALSVKNGVLSMTARERKALGSDGEVYPYTSGMINTGGEIDSVPAGFTFQYGYVEARLKIPAGRGLWPAFWMLPASHNDAAGEIDIMEVIGHHPSTLETTYHRFGHREAASTHAGTDLSKAFHTFAVDWRPDSITWYLDGREVFRTERDIIREPMYLILNLAVGGDWPGPPNDATEFPATMQVDYVRVWQRKI